MDYSETYEVIVKMAAAQGIDKSYLERHETLYYDESGNEKHLIVKNGNLNSDYSLVFVLGGIQAESDISLDALKIYMGKSPTKELKAKTDLKGDFCSILRKENFRTILQLLAEKDWHIHFSAVQILYYGFVDIVDSIKPFIVNPFEFKALLYDVLKADPNTTITHFRKHKYPNIKQREIDTFIDGILDMIDAKISVDASHLHVNPYLFYMRSCFEESKKQRELTFIQDEDPHTWVSNFVQFYRSEILKFKAKSLFFDEEQQIQNIISKEDITLGGVRLTNYSFMPSESNAMIQISDYVVSILRKYIMFLDREQASVETDIKSFEENQMANFMLLNNVLMRSLKHNPMFVHFIASIHVIRKYHKYLKEYGTIK